MNRHRSYVLLGSKCLVALHIVTSLAAAEIDLKVSIEDAASQPIIAGAGEITLVDANDSKSISPVSNFGGTLTMKVESSRAYSLSVKVGEYCPGALRIEVPAANATFYAGKIIWPKPDASGKCAGRPVLLNENRDIVNVGDKAGDLPYVSTTAPDGTYVQRLSNSDLTDVPAAADQDLRNFIDQIPSAIQDQNGRIHVNGGGEGQTEFRIDGFNLSSPLSRYLEARMNIDAVQSVNLKSTGISADHGRGSAGSLNLETLRPDPIPRALITNFIPEPTIERGFAIDRWTPRLLLSGPLGGDCRRLPRAWIQNATQAFYRRDVVEQWQEGENTSRVLDLSNLSHLWLSLGKHRIVATYLYNRSAAEFAGLGALSPRETTVERRDQLFFGSVRDRWQVGEHLELDIGYAEQRVESRSTPYGDRPFSVTPSGTRGNYFAKSDNLAGRKELVLNGTIGISPNQTVIAGVDLQRPNIRIDILRSGYSVLRDDGTTARLVNYLGSGIRSQTNIQASEFVQYSWRHQSLSVNVHLRSEWDQVTRRQELSPRAGLSFVAPLRILLHATIGLYLDELDLNTTTLNREQFAQVTTFDRAGNVLRTAVNRYLVDEHGLRTPRSANMNFGGRRDIKNWTVGVNVIRRNGTHGFLTTNKSLSVDIGNFEIESRRMTTYKAAELSAQRSIGNSRVFVGYTRSQSRTNSAVDLGIDNPIIGTQGAGPLPWDAPHRLLAWGRTDIPGRFGPQFAKTIIKDMILGYSIEYRTGFPFSIFTEDQVLYGAPNSSRLPAYRTIDLSVEKKIRLLRRTWLIRGMIVNAANGLNPTSIHNTIGGSHYLELVPGQKRSYSLRLRFLGQKEKDCS